MANQARTACAVRAAHVLIWERSPDDLWIAEVENEVYQVEMDPPEEKMTPLLWAKGDHSTEFRDT